MKTRSKLVILGILCVLLAISASGCACSSCAELITVMRGRTQRSLSVMQTSYYISGAVVLICIFWAILTDDPHRRQACFIIGSGFLFVSLLLLFSL